MKKVLLLIFFLAAFCFTPFVSAQSIGEHISDFQTHVVVNQDGTVDVTETIYYDFGSLQRHGIYRYIPYTKMNDEGKRVVLDFDNIRVTDEHGKKYRFAESKENWNLQLKIGDPDRTITGEHIYVISYTVKGALGYFENYDEIYWNVTGNGWDIPIDRASMTVTLPATVDGEKVKMICFVGAEESNEQTCEAGLQGNTATISSSRPLYAAEGLTAAVSFPKGTTATLLPETYVPFWERWYGKILFLGILIVATFWYIIYPIKIILRWFRQGRDPKSVVGEAQSWYDGPKTRGGRPLTPGETGALLDEKVDNQDISAMIVDLARRGYFKIEERAKKDFYFIRKAGPKKDTLQPFESSLINGIFGTDEEVRIKDEKLYTTISSIKSSIYKNLVDEGFFAKNPDTIRNFYIAMGVLGITTLNLPVFIAAILFGRHIPSKTQLGSDAAAVGRSLKNFLSSQERQLEFQAKYQYWFERFLPFAVAFGVEKIWAERFKNLHLKEPEWYSSYNSGHFSSTHFTNSLNSSFASVASASTPPSSSSSGFSGGSSGGGGGGGGGR